MDSGTKLGHCEFLALLDKGLGEVWKARDQKLGRELVRLRLLKAILRIP